jgi:hypothetical protein
MRTAFACTLLVSALASLSGCVVSPAASDVAGNWSGSYVDGKSNANGPLSATFAEQAGNLSGTLTITGWACSASSQGNVSGTVTGSELQASATFGLIAALSFTGNVSGNTLTGSYQITSGVCSGDSGSFSMTR